MFVIKGVPGLRGEPGDQGQNGEKVNKKNDQLHFTIEDQLNCSRARLFTNLVNHLLLMVPVRLK